MENTDIILKELKELSPAVANINRRNVYSVPSRYFLNLAEHLLAYVKEHSDKSTLGASDMPFKVPDLYFDGLSIEILKKVKQQHSTQNEVERELAEIAPLLNTISKHSTYKVPVEYFENLEVRKDGSKAKVVSMGKSNRFVRYAAAAAITGLVAIGGLFYANNDSSDNSAPKFSQQQVKQLSDEEIVNYLNSDPAAMDVTIINNDQEKEIINHTKELTDEEILKFLEENGEPVETEDQEG
ncbi:MAG TPA: hypothetical protein VF622_19935 [Segetibacter sp.]|jgi:hypothetical protein